MQYVLRYTGKFFEPDQYRNIVLRSNADGSVLRLREVADVEIRLAHLQHGLQNRRQALGRHHAQAAPRLQRLRRYCQRENPHGRAAKTSFPPGMKYSIAYDVSRFLDASFTK
jgi:multidrug efflux pump subunit AcrB